MGVSNICGGWSRTGSAMFMGIGLEQCLLGVGKMLMEAAFIVHSGHYVLSNHNFGTVYFSPSKICPGPAIGTYYLAADKIE